MPGSCLIPSVCSHFPGPQTLDPSRRGTLSCLPWPASRQLRTRRARSSTSSGRRYFRTRSSASHPAAAKVLWIAPSVSFHAFCTRIAQTYLRRRGLSRLHSKHVIASGSPRACPAAATAAPRPSTPQSHHTLCPPISRVPSSHLTLTRQHVPHSRQRAIPHSQQRPVQRSRQRRVQQSRRKQLFAPHPRKPRKRPREHRERLRPQRGRRQRLRPQRGRRQRLRRQE